MGDPELARLSMGELRELRRRVSAEIERRSREHDHELRQRGGLVDSGGPRYRNPANPAETWSGRPPCPAWVERARARGIRLADLEVADDRPVPRGPRDPRGPRRR